MRIYATILCMSFILQINNVFADDVGNIELLASSCAACHGTRGHSVGDLPSLATLDPLYIVEQMTQFSSGERSSTVMYHIASAYTSDEINKLAEFFSRQ